MRPIQEHTQPGGISDGAPVEVRDRLEVEEIDWAAEAIGVKIYTGPNNMRGSRKLLGMQKDIGHAKKRMGATQEMRPVRINDRYFAISEVAKRGFTSPFGIYGILAMPNAE